MRVFFTIIQSSSQTTKVELILFIYLTMVPAFFLEVFFERPLLYNTKNKRPKKKFTRNVREPCS